MFGTQGEFEFGEMRKTGHVVSLPRKQELSTPERDKRIVEMRRANVFYGEIKKTLCCSDATISKVLRRDAPELLKSNVITPPKKDPRSEGKLLALPPTDSEPLAKLGVHFWDMPAFGQCKYIVAKDPDDKLARYCGEGTVTFGCSWCEQHLAVVAQPKKKFMAEAA